MAFLQGFFRPKHPEKYKGDVNNIVYRSSYELKAMMFFDHTPEILEWSSEEMYIGYVSALDGEFHKYFPDFIIKKRNRQGKIITVMIEVKPKHQTKPPVKKDKVTRGYIREVEEWGRNISKWEYAKKYCEKKGWEFLILTEDHLGIKG